MTNPLIYMNYAATSYTKFPETTSVLTNYLEQNHHLNVSRNLAEVDQTNIIFETRMLLADFFGVTNPKHVVFTSGITLSLNMVLHGLLEEGDHVISTTMEHNAVARPLEFLKETKQIQVTYVPCDIAGNMDLHLLEKSIQPNTKLMVMTHASNVFGTILPVAECFSMMKKHNIITILDTAQTAGFMELNMEKMKIDILTFTGHKSLMGLSGIGGFCVTSQVAKQIKPFVTGGTGSSSHSLSQPTFYPDMMESGTPNTMGILSLHSSVTQLQHIGLERIRNIEQGLLKRFVAGLQQLPITIYANVDHLENSTPTLSIHIPERDSAEISQILFEKYHIITRSGLHCAPLAHQTIGTFPQGTVRFSFGYGTTEKKIDLALAALKEIVSH